MARREPTPKAAELLEHIRAIVGSGDRSTTQSKLVESLDVRNKNSVAVLLDQLESGGWIARETHVPGLARKITMATKRTKRSASMQHHPAGGKNRK